MERLTLQQVAQLEKANVQAVREVKGKKRLLSQEDLKRIDERREELFRRAQGSSS